MTLDWRRRFAEWDSQRFDVDTIDSYVEQV